MFQANFASALGQHAAEARLVSGERLGNCNTGVVGRIDNDPLE